MCYVQGFVLAVPIANRQRFIDHAMANLPLFREYGVTRMVETWADDVPDGTLTDFRRAVNASDDEVVVFSWCEWPSRAAVEAGTERMMSDPRMAEMGEMPFDGKRMIYAGFEPIVDRGAGGAAGYVDGFLVPVRQDQRDAYRDLAERAATVFIDHGATRVMEGWGDYIPDGKVTDFKRAVAASPDETTIFSWVEWPSKEARTKGWEKVKTDTRMNTAPDLMPFDGKRMVYGGFLPILDA